MSSRETKEERQARLSSTERGWVLLALLEEFGTKTAIAKKCGMNNDAVVGWFKAGAISRSGAIALAEATGREKEEFRPDLSAKDWEKKVCGRVANERAVIETADAKLLVRLLEKYGSVRAAGEDLGFSVSDFHQWKSRGRIPAIKLPTLLAAQ